MRTAERMVNGRIHPPRMTALDWNEESADSLETVVRSALGAWDIDDLGLAEYGGDVIEIRVALPTRR